MQLLHLLNVKDIRPLLYARLDTVIRARAFSLEDYLRFFHKIKIWPISAVTTEWDCLENYLPIKHMFSNTWYAYYEQYCLPATDVNSNMNCSFEMISWMPKEIRKYYRTYCSGHAYQRGVLPIVLFFETEDEVKSYFHDILEIAPLAYNVMNEYYKYRKYFNDKSVRSYAKRFLSSNADIYNIRYDFNSNNVDEYLCPILRYCFEQFGDIVKEASLWKRKRQ